MLTWGFFALMALILLFGGGISLLAWIQALMFLRRHKVIGSRQDLDDMKRVVKVNMILALVIIAVAASLALLMLLGGVLGAVNLFLLLIIGLVLGPVCTVIGLVLMLTEGRMKKLEVTSPQLKAEYDHIIQVWNSRPFPDW